MAVKAHRYLWFLTMVLLFYRPLFQCVEAVCWSIGASFQMQFIYAGSTLGASVYSLRVGGFVERALDQIVAMVRDKKLPSAISRWVNHLIGGWDSRIQITTIATII